MNMCPEPSHYTMENHPSEKMETTSEKMETAQKVAIKKGGLRTMPFIIGNFHKVLRILMHRYATRSFTSTLYLQQTRYLRRFQMLGFMQI